MSFLDSRTHSTRQGIGQPVPRAEDRRLITGRGCYSDDVTLPRQAYAAFVRSPHAHARIRASTRAPRGRRPACSPSSPAWTPPSWLGDPAPSGADQPSRSSAAEPRRLAVLRRAAPRAARRPRALASASRWPW